MWPGYQGVDMELESLVHRTYAPSSRWLVAAYSMALEH
jgi:hypothetical protein